MSKRATTAQAVQIGVQTETHTAVPADRRLAALSFDINHKAEVNTHRNAGEKFDSTTVLGNEWSEASAEGLATFTELPLLAAAVIGNRVTTQLGAGVFQHVFTMKNRCTDATETFTIEKGDCETAQRIAGVQLTELSLEVKRADGTSSVSASGFGGKFQTGIRRTGNETQAIVITGTPTTGTFILAFEDVMTGALEIDATVEEVQSALDLALGAGAVVVTGTALPAGAITVEFAGEGYAQTNVPLLTAVDTFDTGSVTVNQTAAGAEPTFVEAVPVTAASWQVTIDPEAAAYGTTDVVPMSAKVDIGDRFNPVWLVTRQFDSYADVVEASPKGTLELTHVADDDGYARTLGAQRSGDTEYVQLDAIGPEIAETGINHSVTLRVPTKVQDVADHSDEDGVYAISATRTFVGPPVLTVVNGLPGI